MKPILSLVVFAFLFSGCTSMGTKTLYRVTKNNTLIKNIGVINLVTDSTNIKICPTIKSVSESAIKESFLENTDLHFTLIGESKDFKGQNLNKENLSALCKEKQVEAILIVVTRFINVNYTLAFIPISSEYHSESLVTLFNSEGNKLISISHNTMRGDDYFGRPSAEVTVRDAIQIALKKMLGITRSLNGKVLN